MENKTYKFVNNIYVILITNIMALIYLTIGLFSFSIIPTINALNTIMNELLDGTIDGYSGIVKYFNKLYFKEFKERKKESLMVGLYTLSLLLSVYILKKIENPIFAIINMLLLYVYILIVVYFSYRWIVKNELNRSVAVKEVLRFMLRIPKNILTIILILIGIILLGTAIKEFLFLFGLSLYSLSFLKINKKLMQNLKT